MKMSSPIMGPNWLGRTDQRQLIILGLFRFSEALAWTAIFPYAYFMVQSFLLETPRRDANAALYASLTVSFFTFGEFLMGLVWAKISDNIGRKPTLLIGVIGGSVSAAAFGCSTSVWMALGARAFGGLVNPNVAVVSAFIGELVKRNDDQGKAFSVVPFLRGLGSLVGPIIGGYLANPVRTLPSIFHRETVWDTYPYLLPNLVVVCFIMSSGLLGFLFLEEVHPKFRHRYDIGLEISRWISRGIRRTIGIATTNDYAAISNTEDWTRLSGVGNGEGANESEPSGTKHYGQLQTPSPSPSESAYAVAQSAYSSQAILQILAVSILAFHKVSSDVIIPMFLGTPLDSTPSGSSQSSTGLFKFSAGFGMDSYSISNFLLSQAVVAIIVQILIVPKIIGKWGALKSFRWSSFVFPWIYCLTPFMVRLPHPLPIVAILLDLWVKGLLVGLGYVCSAILLTNTTQSPRFLATVNGAAASLSCLARSIGAAASGSMFQLGLNVGYIGLPFWMLGILAGFGAVISWYLRDSP